MTLQSDLQRLSNTTLDAQGAANVWAGTTGKDLVGALNSKAGTTNLELAGVLNALASTSGRDTDSALVAVASPNLLTVNQAGIETDATGWVADSNATLIRSTLQFLDGAASLSMAAIGIGVSSAKTTPVTTVPVIADQSYTAKLSMRAATAGRAVRVLIYWYTSASVFVSASSAAGTDVTTGWTELSVTAVVPATAAYASVVANVNDATQLATEVHYVDRISLVRA